MFKIFDRLKGKETKVLTDLHYEADLHQEGFSSDSAFKLCYSPKDFAAVYEAINNEIEIMQSHMNMKFSVEVTLSGKLNGADIDQKFNDLDSYRQFLENNSLIKPSIRLVN